MQKQLVDKLALKILEGEFGEGDLVRIDAADGALSFERVRRSRSAEAVTGRKRRAQRSSIRPGLPT